MSSRKKRTIREKKFFTNIFPYGKLAKVSVREKKAQADITFARIWSYSDLVFVKVFIIEGGLEHDHKGNESRN